MSDNLTKDLERINEIFVEFKSQLEYVLDGKPNDLARDLGLLRYKIIRIFTPPVYRNENEISQSDTCK